MKQYYSSFNCNTKQYARGKIVNELQIKKYIVYVVILCIYNMLNKNTLGVKKVRGQSEAALQIGMRDQKL